MVTMVTYGNYSRELLYNPSILIQLILCLVDIVCMFPNSCDDCIGENVCCHDNLYMCVPRCVTVCIKLIICGGYRNCYY